MKCCKITGRGTGKGKGASVKAPEKLQWEKWGLKKGIFEKGRVVMVGKGKKN